ncbi:aldehyde dehydrogenase family protein [Nitriliruptor alkaliphilus]|uniref:aldehyde dehydrogenase family protein n=1 Tax=Nitriliruptor alkaliphilus TaxID=427918 RepID=UPI000695B8DD|nr:aldehyde dehydrogenase family protein [Nitriliruptor alkaliphilus]
MADVPARTALLIDGGWEDRELTMPVLDTWSGATISAQAVADEADVDRAVDVATRVLRGGPLPLAERAAVLERTADLVRRDREHLAHLIALEAAKPIAAARTEVDRCVETLAFSAAEVRTAHDRTLPMDAHPAGVGATGFVRREPIGVVAAITPFNFPLNLVAHKVGPAVAAGCPVVLKPAERTPLSSIALAERLLDAGLPAGWLAVLTGDGPVVGGALTRHPGVAAVTFTGSAPVGEVLAREGSHAKVLLELGSAAPLVAEADADLATVVDRVVAGGFGHAGQSCVSVQRLLLHERVADDVLDRLVPRVAGLRLGPPLDETSDLSCVIDAAAGERIRRSVRSTVDGGGRVLTGGGGDGAVVEPTVVTDVSLDAPLWTEEVFGPVVAVRTFATTDEAIAAVEAGPPLIHLGVFTRDLDRALTYVDRIRAGAVLVNESPTFRVDQAPYGGVDHPGTTREGPRSTIHELTTEKVVVLRRTAGSPT